MLLPRFAVLLAFAIPLLNTAASQSQTPSQTQFQTQSQSQTRPAPRPAYTIHADTRIVLTDVTVTDAKGNPIHGLPQSSFRIFDNNKPQAIASFEEHTGTPALLPAAVPVKASAPGIYSNDYLLHLPPAVSILVLDTTNLDIPDQMYLSYELMRFLKALPGNQPLAIYLRIDSGSFLLQNFTTDRALLEAALRKAMPRFPPRDREYISDLDTLHQLAVHLNQIPGRKNVLWFSGGSTLYLREDATVFQNQADWRNLYDELEQERIAVYPIDGRGLTITGGPRMWDQHALMNEVAQATGGQAFYNTNGLTETAAHLTDVDRSYYTLTYSPRDLHFDNKWHKVRIALDEGHYQLSYRRGYFADGSLPAAQKPPESRTHLLEGGVTIEEPQQRSQPILFEARVLPASDPSVAAQPRIPDSRTPSSRTPYSAPPQPPPKKGSVPYSIHYTLPASALTQRTIDGKLKVFFQIAAVAFNNYGTPIEHRLEQVSITLNADVLRVHPDAPLSIDQQLNLAKGENYLYLALWDMTSGRVGTLQIPMQVNKPTKPTNTN
jgi:VWFA-related protein